MPHKKQLLRVWRKQPLAMAVEVVAGAAAGLSLALEAIVIVDLDSASVEC